MQGREGGEGEERARSKGEIILDILNILDILSILSILDILSIL